ncbi:MAG: PHP domain-containing protein [Defluviitaleaceae bacterium]|nr:PHP domain-containing protein [Defluviitaleaceae bacterium]MCL2239080.1 PHP domain-containing protein [Defluviitaleaceae bacterium]
MPYRYDLHCHTKEGSKCSDISARQMVEIYNEIGFSGFCITDHFTGRMTALSGETDWEERVNYFYDIYTVAHEEGKKVGMSVFWGIEYSLAPNIDQPTQTTGADFIFLGTEKEWLLHNKDAFREKPANLFKMVRDAGGFIIHAHPMLKEELQLFPYYVDAIEVINGGVDDACNENAKTYSKMYNLIKTAGSDIHRFDHKLIAGMETEKPCHTVNELIDAIKSKQAKPFSMERQVTDYWQHKQNHASEYRRRLK